MDGAGRSETVRRLVCDYHQVVYRFAYRLSGSHADAEDLTQQAFVIACRKLEQLRDPNRARSWLFTIVRHAYLRTLSINNRSFSTRENLPDVPDPGSPHRFPEHIDEEQLQAAIDELPESFKTPLLLYFFDDLSYKEIADQLEVPIGTVMSRLSRAKGLLRDRLSEEQTLAQSKSTVRT